MTKKRHLLTLSLTYPALTAGSRVVTVIFLVYAFNRASARLAFVRPREKLDAICKSI
jgi:hypothetical protein